MQHQGCWRQRESTLSSHWAVVSYLKWHLSLIFPHKIDTFSALWIFHSNLATLFGKVQNEFRSHLWSLIPIDYVQSLVNLAGWLSLLSSDEHHWKEIWCHKANTIYRAIEKANRYTIRLESSNNSFQWSILDCTNGANELIGSGKILLHLVAFNQRDEVMWVGSDCRFLLMFA